MSWNNRKLKTIAHTRRCYFIVNLYLNLFSKAFFAASFWYISNLLSNRFTFYGTWHSLWYSFAATSIVSAIPWQHTVLFATTKSTKWKESHKFQLNDRLWLELNRTNLDHDWQFLWFKPLQTITFVIGHVCCWSIDIVLPSNSLDPNFLRNTIKLVTIDSNWMKKRETLTICCYSHFHDSVTVVRLDWVLCRDSVFFRRKSQWEESSQPPHELWQWRALLDENQSKRKENH